MSRREFQATAVTGWTDRTEEGMGESTRELKETNDVLREG